MSISADSALI